MPSVVDKMQWQRFEIGAGADASVDIQIGSVGTTGPVALITAGFHGDEGPWGAWAIRKALERIPFASLKGTVRIVPVTNPTAMATDARCAPLDSLDMSRVFPGDAAGSHSERIVSLLLREATEDVDFMVDLHGGGSWCVNSFAFSFPGSESLAVASGAPFIAKRPLGDPKQPGNLVSYVASQGAQVTAWEMGGRCSTEEMWADRIATGLLRVLAMAQIIELDEDLPEVGPQITVDGMDVIRPSRGGIFLPEKDEHDIGTVFPKGTVLGHLVDPVTFEVTEVFTAPFEQTAMLLIRPYMAVVEAGAMTYVIGEVS